MDAWKELQLGVLALGIAGCAEVVGYDDLSPTGPGSTGAGGSGGSAGDCVSNQQCTDENQGAPSVCPGPGAACAPLLSEDCTEVVGDFADDNAIVYGYIVPASGSLPNEVIGRTDTCAVEQVVEELTNTIGGLPSPDGATSPVAFVMCDEASDPVRAATHLVNAGVDGILGPYLNRSLTDAAEVTVAANVMMLSPTANGVVTASIDDAGLVWSLNLSASTTTVWAALVAQVESEIRAAEPTLSTIRLALVADGESGAQAMADLLTTVLIVNGKPAAQNGADFLRITAPDGDDATLDDYAPVIQGLVAFNPDVIVLIDPRGAMSFWVVSSVEQSDTAAPAPIWLLESPSPGLVPYVRGQYGRPPPPGFDQRVRAIAPPAADPTIYDTLALNYAARCPDSVPPAQAFFPPWVPYVYDGAWLMALARVAGGNFTLPLEQLTGQALANGLAALSPAGHSGPAATLGLGPQNASAIVNMLVSGGEVDVDGASSHLDFDLTTGSISANGARIMCISPGTNFPESADWAFAGQTYDEDAGTLVGSYACPPSP